MANSGVGAKFVSVNLNKSYGQHARFHSSTPSSNGPNPAPTSSHTGGGGMVVLSRPRSSQKAGPKLSVPPPLNLPSLRKEHQKFDSFGSGDGISVAGVSGSGQRPTSAGMGWTKPGAITMQEKEGFGNPVSEKIDHVLHGSSGSSLHLPFSAGPGLDRPTASSSTSSQVNPISAKATVLRGEDFPSLQAVLPSGNTHKQKDGLNPKAKHISEDLHTEQSTTSHLSSDADTVPQLHLSRQNAVGINEKNVESHSLAGSRLSYQAKKQGEVFPEPLSLVCLTSRSDWADDERDTSHGLPDKGRDYDLSKKDAYWDKDFDAPRVSALPYKPFHIYSERQGLHDNETGKIHSSEVLKEDPYGRDIRLPSREGREGNFWRNSPLPKDRYGNAAFINDRNDLSATPSGLNWEKNNDSLPTLLSRENANNDFGKNNTGQRQVGRGHWNTAMDSHSNIGNERNKRDRYLTGQQNVYRDHAFPNTSSIKSSYPAGGKVIPIDYPMLKFGRDRRPYIKSEKNYYEGPFMKDTGAPPFDGQDPFTDSLFGVVKRKKDVTKQIDFRDPVRESFEAELERVQIMQEHERQRIIEEQERALEAARREEEERESLIREQEESQRRLEEEAREAVWRAEQEQQDAVRRSEEQRVAREEEKRNILLEEERRKLAAKQKLLELEERMARRQMEAVKSDNTSVIPEVKAGKVIENDVSRVSDIGDWEESERIVKTITPSTFSRTLEMSASKSFFHRDGSSGFMERESVNSRRRDIYESGSSPKFFVQDRDNSHHRRDTPTGITFTSKEFHVGVGFSPPRISPRRWISEPDTEDYNYVNEQKSNLIGVGEKFISNIEIDSEFHDDAENNDDFRWGQDNTHGNSAIQFHEQTYSNIEADGSFSFGRSRYSVRQPRVLPPPLVASIQKSIYKENEHPGHKVVSESDTRYTIEARNEPIGYKAVHGEISGKLEMVDDQHENAETEKQRPNSNSTHRCDSQSTLSVSSPPSSPTHLSHDDLDALNFPNISATVKGINIPAVIEDNMSVFLAAKEGKEIVTATNLESAIYEDEWAVENNELQEQEEYDEDDGFEVEDEVHEGEDDNINFIQELEDLHLDEKKSSHLMGNFVLGFNEGVEVGMPSDEFERVSRKDESVFVRPQNHILEEHGSLSRLHGDGQTFEAANASSQVGTDSTSRVFDKPEEIMQKFNSQFIAFPETSAASEVLHRVNASHSSSPSLQHPVLSSIKVESHSSSDTSLVSSASVFPSQVQVPMQLQFGLFSGPSQMASQIPAIQFGSIQMPLPLHPQVIPSMTQLQQSQPPLFQFGHLQYTSPSPVLQALDPHLVPFCGQAGFLTPNSGGSPSVPLARETCSPNLRKSESRLLLMDGQQGIFSNPLHPSQNSQLRDPTTLLSTENKKQSVSNEQGRAAKSVVFYDNTRFEPAFHAHDSEYQVSDFINHSVVPRGKEWEDQAKTDASPCKSGANKKALSGSIAHGPNGRGKKYVFAIKHSGSKSAVSASEATHLDSIGYQRRSRHQRMEFCIRETLDRRQSNPFVSSNHLGQTKISTVTALPAINGSGKFGLSTELLRQNSKLESLNLGKVDKLKLDASKRGGKGNVKEIFNESQNIPMSGEATLKRNLYSEEDVDGPLQSGVVRVFEQPGIEVPSDEDDFIEVRSKRQMLNDRREQREKESRANQRQSKIFRKHRPTSKSAIASSILNKFSAATVGEVSKQIHSDIINDERGLKNSQESSSFNATVASQPLAPIGTPAVKTHSRPLHARVQVGGGGKKIGPGLISESKNGVLDGVQISLDSWGSTPINQQVMSLTQMQLDEAMKPAQFESHSPTVIHCSTVSDSNMTASSILAKDKFFDSIVNPVSSLFPGEKIQFGAVTTPAILPTSCCTIAKARPGQACRDNQVSKDISGSENGCNLFLDKEKFSSESCAHLEDSESEAEVAATAIAVAVASTDEIVGDRFGTCSGSLTKTFGATTVNGEGSADDRQLGSKSMADEPLSVALPADLSIDTPSISLWPPLPSPQNSSNQLLSHFSGGSHSHYPLYEMNHLLGGPIFSFGPHDDLTSVQLMSQKSNEPASGPLGTWQQCQSGMSSFYGTPAGFAGSFISPPGGITGLAGPPHMVVYNHFAPVGQFGQVGLSFMGAYISSGKQPDWKHDPASSGLGDMSNLNLVPGQHNPANMPAPVQHFAPGSPLLPLASPMTIFDVSPFQSSLDASGQAPWPRVPAPSFQSVSQSMPIQPQTEGVLLAQLFSGSAGDHSSNTKRFPGSHISAVPDQFYLTTDASVVHLGEELGIIDASMSANTRVSAHGSNRLDGKNGPNVKFNGQNTCSSPKFQAGRNQISSSEQYFQPSGYSYHRSGNASQKTYGADWSHRKAGFQGKNQSNPASSKVKQIYVAKQTPNAKPTIPL